MESEEQHIRIKAILEVLGKPKEHVEKKLNEYIENIRGDDTLAIISQKVSEPEEKETIWSMFTEIELVIKGVTNLVGFCVDYMPSSIEIVKPEHFSFEERIFTGFINDMIAKLHKIDMIAKQLGTENTFLKENMNKLLHNQMMVLVRLGMKSPSQISRATGIVEEEVQAMLDQLVEGGNLKKEDGNYTV